MFCPGCGNKSAVDLKFCRSCGMNLEQTAISVLEQFPNDARVELRKQERMLEKFGTIAFGGFVIVIGIAVLGILYTTLTTFILTGAQPLAGIVFMAFIIFAALSLGYVFWNESLKENVRN